MLHIIPLDDIKEHIECSTCHCKPTLIIEDGVEILVHNAFDGREKLEMSHVEAVQQYKEMKKPSNFVKHFESKSEFKQWCKDGTKEDLQAALKEFEKDELYEYCAIMREVLNTHYQ